MAAEGGPEDESPGDRTGEVTKRKLQAQKSLDVIILAVCGGNKNIDMSHLLYSIFQYFSTHNNVVYFSTFLGNTWRARE